MNKHLLNIFFCDQNYIKNKNFQAALPRYILFCIFFFFNNIKMNNNQEALAEEDSPMILTGTNMKDEESEEINKSDGICSPFWLILKLCIGTSFLTLPYFSYNVGNLPISMLILLLAWILNYYSTIRYFDCADIMEYKGGSLYHLSHMIYGKFGIIMNEFALFTQLYISAVLYLQTFKLCAQNFLCDTFEIENACELDNIYLIIPYLTIIFFSFLFTRTYQLTPIAIIIGLILFTLIISQYIASILIIVNEGKQNLSSDSGFSDILYIYTASIYAVECSVGLLPFRQDCKKKRDFKIGMNLALVVVFVLYGLLIILVPFAIGSEITEISFLSFDSKYTFINYLGYLYILSIIFFASAIFFPYYYSFEQSQFFKNQTNAGKRFYMILFKISLITLALLLSLLGDNISNTFSILSGLFCPLSCFAVPTILYHKALWIKKKKLGGTLFFDIFLVASTVTFGFIASVYATQEWIES